MLEERPISSLDEPRSTEMAGTDLDRKSKRAAAVGIWGNLLLTSFKVVAGILSNSMAVVGDSLHSLSDLLASALVYVGLREARKPPDTEHPFGHGSIEAVVGLIIAVSLAMIAYEFGRGSVLKLIHGHFPAIGALALVASVLSITVKEAMARYTFAVAREANSPSLRANAWDHRSDAISSVAVLLGVTAAFFGVRIMDPIFALGMAVIIGVIGVKIGKENIENLIGTVPDPEMTSKIRKLVEVAPEVESVHKIRLHYFGSYAEVDMHVIMNPSMSIEKSHAVTDRVIEKVKEGFPEISFVNVHVEPR